MGVLAIVGRIILIILAVIGFAVITLIVLIVCIQKWKGAKGHTFEPFYFTHKNKLVANTSRNGPSYRFDKIDYVEFEVFQSSGHGRAWLGRFYIHKIDGKRSRGFIFSGRLYTREAGHRDSKEDILQVIEILRVRLQKRKIAYVLPAS